MNTRHDTSRAAPRAERTATRDAAGHIRGVEATSGGLIRSTLIATGAAAAMLTVVYLPAEYGIDPTGFGAILGLTEMGQIKQQLYAEAEADAATPAPVTLDPDTLARLDRIEAQLAAIGEVIGAPPTEQVTAAAPAPEPEPTLEPTAEPVAEPTPEAALAETATAVEALVAEAASGWRDEVSYTLAPGEGIEVATVVEGHLAGVAGPVEVAGALFSVGDTHAAQGDGEVCGVREAQPPRQREAAGREEGARGDARGPELVKRTGIEFLPGLTLKD